MRMPRTRRCASQPTRLCGGGVCVPPLLLRDWTSQDFVRLYRVARLYAAVSDEVVEYDGNALLDFLSMRLRPLEDERSATLARMLVTISLKFGEIASLGRAELESIANANARPVSMYPDLCLTALYIKHEEDPDYCGVLFADLSEHLEAFHDKCGLFRVDNLGLKHMYERLSAHFNVDSSDDDQQP